MNLSTPITVEALKVLDIIDKRGSYAAAAEELDKVPSALSYVVQKLEEQLDVTLFQKQGRRSVLTPAGKYLLEEGRDVLNSVERLAEQTQNIARGYETKIRISIDTVMNTAPIYEAFKTFLDEFPLIEIDIREDALNGVWEALITDSVDLVIGGVDPIPLNKGIRAEKIGELELVYAVSKNHPLTNEQGPISQKRLEKERRIVTHDSAREVVTWTRGLHNSTKHFYVPNTHIKRKAQLAGLGVGFLPKYLIADELASGDLVALELETPHQQPNAQHLAWKVVNRGKGLQRLREILKQHISGK